MDLFSGKKVIDFLLNSTAPEGVVTSVKCYHLVSIVICVKIYNINNQYVLLVPFLQCVVKNKLDKLLYSD